MAFDIQCEDVSKLSTVEKNRRSSNPPGCANSYKHTDRVDSVLSKENDKLFIKMDKRNKMNITEAVTSFNFNFDQRKYFFGDQKAPKSGLINDNGMIDTSRKLFQVNRRNYQYKPFESFYRPKSSQYNIKGKTQGDGVKRASTPLPPQPVKQVVRPQEERESMWAPSWDWNPDAEEFKPKAKQLDWRFFLADSAVNTVRTERDGSLDEPFAFEPEAERVRTLSTVSEGEFHDIMDNLSMKFDAQLKQTQGLITLAIDAASSIGSAAGWYYTYKTVDTARLAASAVGNIRTDIFNLVKQNLDILCITLYVAARVFARKMDLDEALLLIGGAIAGKKLAEYFLPSVTSLLTSFVSGLPRSTSHLTTRTTQGSADMEFVPAAIGLIATFVLGTQTEPSVFKGILSAVKGLGSSLLTIKAVDVAVVNLIEKLPDIVRIIISEAFPRFSLYCLLSTNSELREKVKALSGLMCKTDSEILYSSHILSMFLNTYDFFKHAIIDEKYAAAQLSSLIQQELIWLDKTHLLVEKMGLLPGKRHMPFVLWISGDSGIGKSTMVKDMAREALTYLLDRDLDGEDLSKYIFSHNTSNKYFDGYNNQPVFILNDYLQFATEDEEKWLIKFVDTLDLPLEVSSTENVEQGIKGEVRFTSRILIITSNSSYLSTSPSVKELNAFNRRRDLLVKMVFKDPVHRVDFTNWDYSWARFSLLDPLGYQDRAITNLAGIEDLKDVFIARYLDFAKRNLHMLSLPGCSYRNTLAETVQRQEKEKTYEKGFFVRLYEFVKDIMEKEVFGIKVKFLVPVLVVGSTSYYLLAQFLAGAAHKLTQSLSGDVDVKRVRHSYKNLRRTTMGLDMNIDEVTNRIVKNVVSVSTIISYNDRRVNNTMWGLMTGGTMLCVPKHLLWRGDQTYKKGDEMVILWENQEFHIPLEDGRVYQHQDADVAFINTLGIVPNFRSITIHIASDSASIRETEPAVLITKREVSFVQTVEAFIVEGESYEDPLGKVYNPRSMWQYNTKFRVGDCGSPLLLSDSRHMRKLAGIHTAGDDYSGNAAILTIEMVKEAQDVFSNKGTQGFLTDIEIIDMNENQEAANVMNGNFVYMGRLVKPIFQNTETAIRKSPLFEVLQPHDTEPAILSPYDTRNWGSISPMLQSVKKFGEPIGRFDGAKLELAFQLVKRLYAPIGRHKLNVYSFDDAINSRNTPALEKLDIRTSAGYPYCTTGQSKADLIENDPLTGELKIKQVLGSKLNTWENQLKRGVAPPNTLIATLKDERVSLTKVAQVKTRTFTIFPVEMTILMRKYFDDFVDKETEHALEIGTTVGVNIYSSQWNTIYQDLKNYEKHIDGDFKAFDGTIRPEFFPLYARLVNSFYNDSNTNIREILMSMHCFAPLIVLSDVYLKMQGNPSGSRVTTTFNSFVNRMYLALTYLEYTPEAWHTPTVFSNNLRIYAHGDDHLLGVTSELAEYFNAFAIRDYMKQHGIDYTSSVKNSELREFKPLDQCYYLKSHFVYDSMHNVMKAGLDKKVIHEMVSWQRDLDDKTTEMIINTALRYAFFWGVSYFEEVRDKLNKALLQRRIFIQLLDFVDLDNEYHKTGQIVFDF